MNSVFAQYEELSSPQFAVINLSLRLRLMTANFGLNNSSYRAQPHSIIVKYCPFAILSADSWRQLQCHQDVIKKPHDRCHESFSATWPPRSKTLRQGGRTALE